MRLRIVGGRNEIPKLNPDEKMIHLDFKATNVDILNLMQRCPRLRMIHVTPIYRKAMSDALQIFLSMQGIDLLEGDVCDDKNNFDGYFAVDDKVLEEIRAMAAAGLSMNEVVAQVQKNTKISADLVRYIMELSVTA